MEQNQPIVVANKFRKIVRVMYFMLKNEISKGKLLVHLNFMMKRDKIAGRLESINNLMFHHHTSTTKRHRSYPVQPSTHDDVIMVAAAAAAAYEYHVVKSGTAASPALPGFGPSPKVRQLRVTDSPFPLRDNEDDEDNYVDEAAEEFIMKFYRDLRSQNT